MDMPIAYMLLILCIKETLEQPPHFDHGVNLPTTRPLIIAHRGNSGMYPEHSSMAHQSAIDVGADIVECDLCLTRDLQLVCSHEAWLSDTTNIADVFPESRMNTYFVVDQFSNITDYFAVDFDLAELEQVRRRQPSSSRDPNHDDIYPITNLDQLIWMVQNASRPVGLHLETKDPIWVNSLEILAAANTTFEDVILDKLEFYGYNKPTDPIFLQSFSEESLLYFRPRTNLPIVKLLGGPVSQNRLEEIAEYAEGIGPGRYLIVVTVNDHIIERTDLIERAHNLSLVVHPFTFKNEDQNMPLEYGHDPHNEYQDFLNMRADGLFTDHPATYKSFLDIAYGCNALWPE